MHWEEYTVPTDQGEPEVSVSEFCAPSYDRTHLWEPVSKSPANIPKIAEHTHYDVEVGDNEIRIVHIHIKGLNRPK